MIVFIDAYNVLRQEKRSEPVSKAQLQEFATRVFRRAEQKRYQAFIICDGGLSTRHTVLQKGSCSLHHAGYERSADDLIIELCKRYNNYELVVISADRQLCREIELLRAIAISPYIFLNALYKQNFSPMRPLSPTNMVRLAKGPLTEIDLLMQQSNHNPIPEKDFFEEREYFYDSHKVTSQKEKKRIKIIGKL